MYLLLIEILFFFCFSHLTTVLTECRLALDLSLGLQTQLPFEYNPENILISGVIGSGKTAICKIIEDIMRSPPYFVHTHTIDCRSLKGKLFNAKSQMIFIKNMLNVYVNFS